MTNQSKTTARLESLDILRGFDLFLLVFFQPVFIAIAQQADCSWLNAVAFQFDHEVWTGFRFWDLVMPLFLFMTGVAMPFSFAKYKVNPDKTAIYKKIIRRFLLLFIFGMIVQGNLLALDPSAIKVYTNTLQAIAAGYLIAAIILLHCSPKMQIAATALLLFIYWLPMTIVGDFTLEGNFAYAVDKLLLGDLRGDTSYTWMWSSLTFGATVMLGTFAGHIMKNGKENRKRVVLTLLATGLALIAAALLWSLQMPVIKRIWSCSMTLLSGGYCFLLMAAFYYWIDFKGHTAGLKWLKIYGMNSITAYLLGEVVNFRSVAASVTYGLEHILGSYYPAWLTFANFLIIFFILRILYKQRIFLKI